MVLSKSIEVRDSPVAGKGLFATAPIAAGERVWGPDPDEAARYYHTMEQIKTWSEEEQKHFMNNAYLVAPGTYSGVRFGVESDKGEYMNHSCSPNVRIIDDDTWVAWRDIAVGEEVVYDYAASETGESTHMPFSCRCGAAACRGRITGDDCLLPALREKYGSSFTSLTKAKQAAADAAAGKAATA